MIIDVHGHFTTAPARLDAYRGRQLSMLNQPVRGSLAVSDEELAESLLPLLDQMTSRGIDVLMLSPRAAGMGHDIGDALVSEHWTQINNDLIARACALHSRRLVPVCQLPQSPGAAPAALCAEVDRCAEAGFAGCLLNPDVSGGLMPFTPSLRDRWWYPLWERLCELGMPVMVHASATRNPAMNLHGAHYIAQHHAAAVELCLSSVFDDFPELTVIVPHGGGAIPFQFNRQRALHVLQGRPPFEEAVRKLYFDTALYDADALEMLLRKVGPDNVVFGSEMFGTAKAIDPETGRAFDDNLPLLTSIPGLSEKDLDLVLSGNARKLFPRARAVLGAQT